MTDSAAPYSHSQWIGQIVAERYLVHRLLGEGGMGAVYEAEHIHMKKRVALKVLHGEMLAHQEVVARFEREAVAAARIQHPSVVTAMDFGRLTGGAFYLVLEYVEGRSLFQVLEEQGALPSNRVFRILIQINAALIAAHEAGIIHRDLKPENIMLVDTGEDDFVKILDFGIAKLYDDEQREGAGRLTRAGALFGTPAYMSPEQARGQTVDARADLYALGLIGYEMLSGRRAFDGEDVMAVLTAQLNDRPEPLSSSVPPALAQLIFRLLEKDPDKRPASAQELGEVLHQISEMMDYSLPPPRTSAGTRLDRGRGSHSGRRSSSGALSGSSGALSGTDSSSDEPASSLQAAALQALSPKKRRSSLWVPLVTLLCGLGLGLLVVFLLPVFLPGWGLSAEAVQLEEERLLQEARAGDREKLAELRKKMSEQGESETGELSPEELERETLRWMALGRGYRIIRHYTASLQAYQRAVEQDPHLALDSELLADVRIALEQRDTVEQALEFAQTHLGSAGADLIYDVWRDHLGQPGMTAVVARAQRLVRDRSLREQASPALQVALDLERAKVCAEYREILPRAVETADERSLQKLEALQARRGCGSQRTQDCFPCLRAEEEILLQAIAAAKARPAPALVRAPDELTDEAP